MTAAPTATAKPAAKTRKQKIAPGLIDCNASGAICGRYQGYALAAWSEAPGLCGARTMRRAFDERLKKLPGAPHKPKPTPRFEYTFNSAILGGMDDPNAPPEVNVAELRTAAERQLRANAKTDPEARAALQRLIQKGRLRDIGRRVLFGPGRRQERPLSVKGESRSPPLERNRLSIEAVRREGAHARPPHTPDAVP